MENAQKDEAIGATPAPSGPHTSIPLRPVGYDVKPRDDGQPGAVVTIKTLDPVANQIVHVQLVCPPWWGPVLERIGIQVQFVAPGCSGAGYDR